MSEKAALNLAQKVARVMGAVSRVAKNGHNSFHNYDYATEGDVADTVRAALAEVGVAIIPSTEKIEWRDAPATKAGAVERIATAWVRYTITDGAEKFESVFVGEGQDRGDKAVYKAYTGAHKYFLLRTFNISTGDDNDPEREEDTPPRRASNGNTSEPAGPTVSWEKRIAELTTIEQCKTLAQELNKLPKAMQEKYLPAYNAQKKKLQAAAAPGVTKDLLGERQAGEEG